MAVVALAVLSVLVYLLSGGTWLTAKTYVTTYLPDSTGLAPGADVQLNGVEIGKVEWMRLSHSRDPNRVVEVRLKIEKLYLPYIPDDSVTEIDSANLLGDQYIDILMGKSPRPAREGSELLYRVPTNVMQNIDLLQFDAQLRTIDQIIIDLQAGKGSLGQFIVSDALYQQFLKGIADLDRSLRAATSTQSRLGQVLYSAADYENVSGQLRQLDDRLGRLQSSRMLRDASQYDQMRDEIAGLRRTLADLNAGRGAAGQFLTSDAAYTQWTRILAGWIDSVDALNTGEGGAGQILASAQAYESLNGALRAWQATLKDFREHPRKYMRLKVF